MTTGLERQSFKALQRGPRLSDVISPRRTLVQRGWGLLVHCHRFGDHFDTEYTACSSRHGTSGLIRLKYKLTYQFAMARAARRSSPPCNVNKEQKFNGRQLNRIESLD
ncbi:hypothetical protein EVAR_40675_1 [Eumeta japonica]|uniref:Uncharacterized protein n=1 Tax=Eumeta variegata TaxID=151549 RepID=A0A4C1X4R5_EUMVA|nr:hypothetical protein EVAR_40675_1 [Eumeta japonica]